MGHVESIRSSHVAVEPDTVTTPAKLNEFNHAEDPAMKGGCTPP